MTNEAKYKIRLLTFVTLLTLVTTFSAFAQQQLSIATGGTGGVYYPLGGGLAEIISTHVDGYSATAEVTGASVENMGLIARGDADIAFALADTVQQAYTGTGRFGGQKLEMLRGMAALYENTVQIVTLADNGIVSLSDLTGKRVSVGAPGSGTEVNANTILAANGIDYSDITVQRLNFNETADALANGDIDVGFLSVAAPTSSVLNLATTHSIRLIELSEAELARARQASPIYTRATISGSTYPGITGDTAVLGVPNILVVSADMPDALVYAVTRALFEYKAELGKVHPAANQISVEFTLSTTPVPLHPGAIRYYEEIGAPIPTALRP